MNIPPPPDPPAITEAQMLLMSKEQLATALKLAFDIQRVTTKNMAQLMELLKKANERIEAQDSKLASQEAEIIALRNRP